MNRQWILARPPVSGFPTKGDFELVESELPSPAEGQALTRTVYLSMDPYQWGRRRSGAEAVGDVLHGRTVAEVVESRSPDYNEGDVIFNTNGWQEYGLTGPGVSVHNYMFPRRLDPTIAPISTALGVFGMLGLTAYSGISVLCQPRAGDTVVVSAASGGVGQVAGQIAKILGCRTVGIAGIADKCRFVTDVLGFDACVSHLSPGFPDELQRACRDGIDVYFENVGGKVFEAVLPLLNRESRIAICGMISQYALTDGSNPQEAWRKLGEQTFAERQVTAHPLFVGNFVADHQARFLELMGTWIQEGRVKYKEDLWPGLEQAPKAFDAMLRGGNFGKTIVGVGADPTLDATIEARRAGSDILGTDRLPLA